LPPEPRRRESLYGRFALRELQRSKPLALFQILSSIPLCGTGQFFLLTGATMKNLPLFVVLGFTTFCAVMAGVVVYIAPSPIPAGYAQLLAAFIALFTAGGYQLFKYLNRGASKRRIKGQQQRHRRLNGRRDIARRAPHSRVEIPSGQVTADHPLALPPVRQSEPDG
jgi:hypothetical protein